MSAGVTNRGKMRLLENALQRTHAGTALPSNYYLALVTADVPPTKLTDTFNELTEITAGNGYSTGGQSIDPWADFDNLQEDDADDLGYIQLTDIYFEASGGTVPPSGDGASYVVMLDDNAVITDREVYAWWSLGGVKTVPDGERLVLKNLEIRAYE